MGTFALGTAAGDFTADGLGWGTFASGLCFTLLILVPALGYRYLHWNSIFSFWFAYIMTRPLGASCGDYLSQPVKNGGLGFGATITSVFFLAAILSVVAYLMVTKCDTEQGIARSK